MVFMLIYAAYMRMSLKSMVESSVSHIKFMPSSKLKYFFFHSLLLRFEFQPQHAFPIHLTPQFNIVHRWKIKRTFFSSSSSYYYSKLYGSCVEIRKYDDKLDANRKIKRKNDNRYNEIHNPFYINNIYRKILIYRFKII